MRTGEQIIADVAETVSERRRGYGHPAENFRSIAIGWQEILKCEVTARQVALCMMWLKCCRLISQPDHEDSVTDLHGYAMCYADCGEPAQEPKPDTADPAWLDAPLPDHMTFRTCDGCPIPVRCRNHRACLDGPHDLSEACRAAE